MYFSSMGGILNNRESWQINDLLFLAICRYQKKLESNLRELAALLETEIPSSPAAGQQQ
jgi:hypothetical protein